MLSSQIEKQQQGKVGNGGKVSVGFSDREATTREGQVMVEVR